MGGEALKKKNGGIVTFIEKYNTYLIFLLFIVISSLLSENFLTWKNLGNLIKQNAASVFMAEGMLFVLMTGNIDLSVGSVIAIGNVVSAYVLEKMGLSLGWAIVLSLAAGVLMGVLSGALVAYLKMMPFVATLATQIIGRGLVMMFANGANIRAKCELLSASAKQSLLKGTALESNIGELFTFFTVLIILLVVVFAFVQKYTKFGRLMQAIGSNEEAVRLAGIKTKRIIFAVYVICGLCCAAAGIMFTARTSTGVPTAAAGYEGNAIASNVLGGVSLSGGQGSVIKVLIGVFIFALISNIMNLLGVASYPQDVIKGIIIVVAVALQKVGK